MARPYQNSDDQSCVPRSMRKVRELQTTADAHQVGAFCRRCMRWLAQASPQAQWPAVHSMRSAALRQSAGSQPLPPGRQLHSGTVSGCGATWSRPTMRLRCSLAKDGGFGGAAALSRTAGSPPLLPLPPPPPPGRPSCDCCIDGDMPRPARRAWAAVSPASGRCRTAQLRGPAQRTAVSSGVPRHCECL